MVLLLLYCKILIFLRPNKLRYVINALKMITFASLEVAQLCLFILDYYCLLNLLLKWKYIDENHCLNHASSVFEIFVDKSNKCFQMLLTANLTSLLEFPRILIVCLSFQFFLLFQILNQLLHHNLDSLQIFSFLKL